MENGNQSLQVIPTGTYDMQYAVCLTKEIENDDFKKKKAQSIQSNQIKSSAIDLYSTPSPAKFFQLQRHTDLNRPPSNWLSGVNHMIRFPARSHDVSNLPSSFQMASTFLDCIGKVDVVSDAENIKKLLKIPYSKSQVSMMVHRIGNSLLLDEFDIHTHLLRTAENEWAWLKKFYYEHIFESIQSKGKDVRKSASRHSRTYLQQQNLIAKFLYHSLANESSNMPAEAAQAAHEASQQVQQRGDQHTENEKYHRNDFEDSVPKFSKNIIWTFENIRMLIGTDLPIFGGNTHPCLSLRLRDMNKPINVLTGIDYWLDNLMSNVPEVVMCYHLGGLVQKYELIKTEDLPRLPDSSFAPGVIRDVAQNILSFLKSKATKPGHTYWLFKGKGDDIVKLYDLTSLCSDLNEDPSQNPFTTPVAMLLFKVAKNLKSSSDWRRHQGTVVALLKNCLEILDADKYPQIAVAALFYLADIFLPSSRTDVSNENQEEAQAEDWTFDLEEGEIEGRSVADDDPISTSQAVTDKVNASSPKLSASTMGDSKQRAIESLENAVKALNCLSTNSKGRNNEPTEEADGPPLASPLRPIPMPYTDTKKSEESGTLVTKEVMNDWKQQWCQLLLEKCFVAYVTLAESSIKEREPNLDECLSCLKMIGILWHFARANLDCSGSPNNVCSQNTIDASWLSLTHGVVADIYFVLVQRWNEQSNSVLGTEHHFLKELNQSLLKFMGSVNPCSERTDDPFPIPVSLQQALELSFKNYKLALDLLGSIDVTDSTEALNLSKRLGNVCNELGVFFMSKASALIENLTERKKPQLLDLYSASQKHLENGISVFKNIRDSSNVALLHANLGKLYRLQARALAPAEMKEITIAEWKCYKKALSNYREALEQPDLNEGISDAVVWEYTSVLFTLASLLQDFAPLSIKSREEIETEISSLLETCIKLCEVDEANIRQPLYQYRAATCHYRLASLFHDTYRNGSGEAIFGGKNVRSLAESHYNEASSLYLKLDNWEEFLRIQLERIGLYEFQLRHSVGVGSKIRCLRLSLNCLLSSSPAVSALAQVSTELDPKNSECLKYVCTHLHSTLLELTKLTKKHCPKKMSEESEIYRKMYLVSLKCNPKDPGFRLEFPVVLEELSKLLKQHGY